MPQIILDEPRVRALIRQGIATSMAQHVRVRRNRQPSPLRQPPQNSPHRLTAERLPTLAQKEMLCRLRRLEFPPPCQPCLDRPQLVSAERLGGGQPFLEPLHMQDAAHPPAIAASRTPPTRAARGGTSAAAGSGHALCFGSCWPPRSAWPLRGT